MTRIISQDDDGELPRISRSAVAEFFEKRAAKYGQLGQIRTVIYQDKHPDLAERRDIAEKAVITPLLQLDGTNRFLDVGCGTGRWIPQIIDHCAAYHGIDLSAGLIEIARSLYGDSDKVTLSVSSVDALTLRSIGAPAAFDRILCAGVFIYLNDDELHQALNALASVAAEHCRMVLREPLATEARLSIVDHFSDDMEQSYNAIYRTEKELLRVFEKTLFAGGFKFVESGDVYADPSLNNRSDTRQRWLVLER